MISAEQRILIVKLVNACSIQPNGCWLWQKAKWKTGYGASHWQGKQQKAHRLMAEAFYGPIEPNLLVCHRCDVPACINPEHLFVGTANRYSKNEHPRRLN